MHIFISYQTKDKIIASKVKDIFTEVGFTPFMAHEDINVSEEWRVKILQEIGKANIFISLLSKHYNHSFWCIQELGIASFRTEMTIIPLSIDGSVPPGFASNIQSAKIDPENVCLDNLLPGIIKADFEWGIGLIFKIIAGSYSYSSAEINFKRLLPYIDKLSPEQGKEILEISIKNSQIYNCTLCKSKYLTPIMLKNRSLLSSKDNELLEKKLKLLITPH